MKPETKTYQTEIGGKTIIIETGKLASQAGGAASVRIGDTVIFAAATMSNETRPNINFIPLSVDYEERMYAGGRIPGSFFRREGRPTDEAILTSRLTDRTLRPLFPKDMRNDVQVILYSFSADGENPIDILAITAASTALTISDIPWDGPVGGIRIGHINGEFVVFPTFAEMEQSDLDLRMSSSPDAIMMVECGANEVSEEIIVQALEFGHEIVQPLIQLQRQIAAEIGKPKREYPALIEEPLPETVLGEVTDELNAILATPKEKDELNAAVDALRTKLIMELSNQDENTEYINTAFNHVYQNIVRQNILRNMRPDGRSPSEIRPIWCEVGVSPRAHGSGLFTRGSTQALTLATLGTPREAQSLDNLTPFEEKRYMHHYNFPPFSVGETQPLRGASRREIGHGALAERALLPVIPDETEFPYTLRLVSEVLSSNGSTSMASVCGSTLALMDTGVPIKAPVAGIAMGLIKEGEHAVILSDIQGLEDFLGDMDFKVAGTERGITALQMDIKIKGITTELISEALEQAHQGRLHILSKMLEVIPEPRPELKPHVPRISVIQIPVEKIGAIIGPGGKIIRSIQEETQTKIDIMDDGLVYIASNDGEGERLAREKIELLTEEPKIGHIYTGRVVRTTDFGAFVEILPNTDGLVHISQLDVEPVDNVEDVVRVGDEITVMITDIDENGRIRLSREAVLEGWTAEEARNKDRRPRRSRSSHYRGSRHPRESKNRKNY
ncbi:MAG: polyribonucleotide nucleotidyltransferase [Chloroflexota bacterium]